MSIPYDIFIGAFLNKISEYELLQLEDNTRTEVVDGYLRRAVTAFKKNCKYDFFTTRDDDSREFLTDIPDEDLDELVDIISEGMLVQWLKPYVYQQELLQNVLNTRDFTQYSPAELLMRVGNAYAKAQKDYTQMIREYSYNHGDLTDLHI
jgi:hypothetical protein